MDQHAKIFWSAKATAQFLELDPASQGRVDSCVDLISQFPMIGTRLLLLGSAEIRRFVCAGFQIIYDLAIEQTGILQDPATQESSEESKEITVSFVKRL